MRAYTYTSARARILYTHAFTLETTMKKEDGTTIIADLIKP